MKIQRSRGYRDLMPVKMKLGKYLRCLKFPEFCLGHIEKNPIPSPKKYRAALLKFLAIKKPCVYPDDTVFTFIKSLPRLENDAELGVALAKKVIDLLEIEGTSGPETERTVDAKHYLRGYLFMDYYLAKSLESVMSKNMAIKYFQSMNDAHTRTMTFPKMKKVSEMVFDGNPTGAFKNAFNMTEFILDEGRSGCRADKCKWAEVMKELNDPDYAYAVACHYDFEAVRMRNSAFVLTRTGTLAQGKPYCDFFWHDTRVNKDLTHPPKEFWDKL